MTPLEIVAAASRLVGGACTALFRFCSTPVDADDDFDEQAADRYLKSGAAWIPLSSSPKSAADGEAHPASARPAEVPAPPDLPRAGGTGTPNEAVTVQWIRNTDSFALKFAHNGFRYSLTPSQALDLVAQLNGELGARTAAFDEFAPF